MNRKIALAVLMLVCTSPVFVTQARAAELVGVTNGSITDYLPRLQVHSVLAVNYNGYSTFRDIRKKFKGKYGQWETKVESQIGATWKAYGAKVCAKTKYYAISDIQRNILVIEHGVFVQMTADIVCGD